MCIGEFGGSVKGFAITLWAMWSFGRGVEVISLCSQSGRGESSGWWLHNIHSVMLDWLQELCWGILGIHENIADMMISFRDPWVSWWQLFCRKNYIEIRESHLHWKNKTTNCKFSHPHTTHQGFCLRLLCHACWKHKVPTSSRLPAQSKDRSMMLNVTTSAFLGTDNVSWKDLSFGTPWNLSFSEENWADWWGGEVEALASYLRHKIHKPTTIRNQNASKYPWQEAPKKYIVKPPPWKESLKPLNNTNKNTLEAGKH